MFLIDKSAARRQKKEVGFAQSSIPANLLFSCFRLKEMEVSGYSPFHRYGVGIYIFTPQVNADLRALGCGSLAPIACHLSALEEDSLEDAAIVVRPMCPRRG